MHAGEVSPNKHFAGGAASVHTPLARSRRPLVGGSRRRKFGFEARIHCAMVSIVEAGFFEKNEHVASDTNVRSLSAGGCARELVKMRARR